MKASFILLLAALTLQLPPNSNAPPERKATIAGSVLRVGTGEPLARTEVTLSTVVAPPTPGPGGEIEFVPSETTSVMTGADGRFVLKDVNAGDYRLRAKHNGYVSQWYGQRGTSDQGVTVKVVAGQELKDIGFQLQPAAIVTGRVRDSVGDPAVGVRIQLLKRVYDNLGARTFQPVGAATTDDRGEYRVFGIAPGRYLISAVSGEGDQPFEYMDFGPFVGSNTDNVVRLRGQPTTYYPGTIDSAQALVMEIAAGAELAGIDFAFQNANLYKVRGTVIDVTGKSPRSVELSLYGRGANRYGGSLESRYYSARYTNGRFEFKNVVPGAYWLMATQQRNEREPLPEGLLSGIRTASDIWEVAFAGGDRARVAVDVAASDVDGLVVKLTPGLTLPIEVQVEGRDNSTLEGLSQFRLGLWPRDRDGANAEQRGSLDQKGLGKIENILVGEYRAWITAGMPGQQNLYLKEARLGSGDALDGFVQVEEATTGPLRVVLGTQNGLVEGTLTDVSGKTIPGFRVNLIPSRNRYRDELHKSTQTDANGHFTFRGVPPGDYKLFAWESIEPFSWYDPEIFAKYETKGTPVSIGEGSSANVSVKLIPPIN